jgi:TPR repeat protein
MIKLFYLLFFGVNFLQFTYAESQDKSFELLTRLQSEILAATPESNGYEQVIDELHGLKLLYPKEANYLLGELYYFGLYGKLDVNKAVFHLTASADAGDPRAMYLLGSIFVDVQEKHAVAIDYLEQAAKNGVQDAMFNLFSLYKKKRYPRENAIFWLTELAKQGDEESVLMLAQEQFQLAKNQNDTKTIEKLIDELTNCQIFSIKGPCYFLLSIIHSDPSNKFYNQDTRTNFLKLSAEAGYPEAQRIYAEYLKREANQE